MLKHTTSGLGTQWWFFVYDDINDQTWNSLIKKIEQEIYTFNLQYSRFLSSSFVGQLNNQKMVQNFNREFLNMVVFAQQLKINSFNFFDVAVGKTLIDIGYNETFIQEKNLNYKQNDINIASEKINHFLQKTKFNLKNIAAKSKSEDQLSVLCDNVFLEITPLKIRISNDSVIDFGGFGKGWLVDKLVKIFSANKIKSFTINAGGDVFSTGDTFYLENPNDITQSIGTIKITNQAIACSSSNRRTFLNQKHHLINPLDKESKNYYSAVFTQANTTLKADVASTILFVSPIETHDKLYKILDVEYMLIFNDGRFFKSSGYSGKLHTS